MTNKELQEILKQYPDEMEVKVYNPKTDDAEHIFKVTGYKNVDGSTYIEII